MKRVLILMEILQVAQVVCSLCKRGDSLKVKSGGKLNTTKFKEGFMEKVQWLTKLVKKQQLRIITKAAQLIIQDDVMDELFYTACRSCASQDRLSANSVELGSDFKLVRTTAVAKEIKAKVVEV